MTLPTFGIDLDLDRDSYFNVGVGASDPLNLVPTPVLWTDIATCGRVVAEVPVKVELETAYGVNVMRHTTSTDVFGGIYFGRDADSTVYSIPVTAGQQYTARVWVRGLSGYAGINIRLEMVSQAEAVQGSAVTSVAFSGNWQSVDKTFTAGVGVTHIYWRVLKNNSAAVVSFEATGFMLVAGATMPSAFNAGHATNTLDSLIAHADVKAFDFAYGFQEAFESDGLPAEVAPGARMTLILANRDGDLWPEITSGPYYQLLRGRPLVRLRATDATGTETLFIGKLVAPDYSPANDELKEVVFHVVDMLPTLTAAEYVVPFSENVRPDEVLAVLYASNPAQWPYRGVTRTIFEGGVTRTTLEMYGDAVENTSRAGVSPLNVIRDMAASELGRHFYDAKTGLMRLHNRLRDSLEASAVTLTEADLYAVGTIYRDQDTVVNKIVYNHAQHVFGAAGTVVYSHPNLPYRIPPETTRRWQAPYSDPLTPDARVAVRTGVQPVAYSDYSATQFEDGSGADMTPEVEFEVEEFGGQFMKLRLQNNDETRDAWLQTPLRARATPIYVYPQARVEVEDTASADAYDPRPASVRYLNAIGDADSVREYAEFLISRFKDPMSRLESVAFIANTAALVRQALVRAVGDRVTETVNYLNHDADYIIVGIEMRYDASAGELYTRWVQFPVARALYFKVGDPVYGKLDSGGKFIL